MTPLQSWLLLVALFGGVFILMWIASRPSFTHRRRHRLHQQQLEELARHERARAAIARAQSQSNVQITRSRKGGKPQ